MEQVAFAKPESPRIKSGADFFRITLEDDINVVRAVTAAPAGRRRLLAR
jgi:hypothetical protein